MSNTVSNGARRRAFLKLMAATPLFATMATQSFAKTVSGKAMGNAYEKLGIRPLINARGTYTYVGGSLELPRSARGRWKRPRTSSWTCSSCSMRRESGWRKSPAPNSAW